nr:hypothetical protein [Paucibacter sp. M5-1]MCZ7882322.1 hypothetical protein [Paucibacter sp. M5-1]
MARARALGPDPEGLVAGQALPAQQLGQVGGIDQQGQAQALQPGVVGAQRQGVDIAAQRRRIGLRIGLDKTAQPLQQVFMGRHALLDALTDIAQAGIEGGAQLPLLVAALLLPDQQAQAQAGGQHQPRQAAPAQTHGMWTGGAQDGGPLDFRTEP